jgi:hypothetical protein
MTEEPSLKLLRRLLLFLSFLVMAVGVASIILTRQSISYGIKETSMIQRGADRMAVSQVLCVDLEFWTRVLLFVGQGVLPGLSVVASPMRNEYRLTRLDPLLCGCRRSRHAQRSL